MASIVRTVSDFDRVTIRNELFHERAKRGGPLQVANVFWEFLERKEQPYVRDWIEVGKAWSRIDSGWIESHAIGIVWVENLLGRDDPGLRLGSEEWESIKDKAIAIRFGMGDVPHLIVRPFEGYPFRVFDGSAGIFCKSVDGSNIPAKVVVFGR